ncbi:MAG TPA: hypothetical protein VMT20_09940 [Terriglobia bacterium]|nr:hypothetical protein [Terriglobia bacterium]
MDGGQTISDLGEGVPQASFFTRQKALISILAWVAVSGLSGCGSGSAVLRNLPTSATGTFFIKQKVLPDAVSQRPYTAYINTKGGSGQVSSCKLAGDSAGLSAIQQPLTINRQSAPTFCQLKSQAMTAPAGPHTFNLTATDTQGNNVTASFTVNVRPEFVFSQKSLKDGVTGRTYGQAKAGFSQAVTTTLGQSKAGNAPLTSCAMTVSGGSNPGLLSPLPINQLTSTTPAQCQLQSLNNTPLAIPGSTAVTYELTISGTDTPIEDKDPDVSAANLSPQAVPQHTASTALSLTVNPAISFAPNSIVINGTAMDAVNGRTYGAGSLASNSAKTSLSYTATGGLLTTAGLKFSPSGGGTSLALPKPITCPALNAVQVGSASLVCSSGNQAVSDTPHVFSFGLSVSDAGNAATPPGSTSSDIDGDSQYELALDAALADQLSQVTTTTAPVATATNPSSLLDAVMDRSYGVIGGTPTYTASGGLGPKAVGGGGYIWCLSQGSLPGGFTGISNGTTCSTATTPAPTSPGNTISLQASNVTGAASNPPAPITFTVLLDDTGNAAVPSGAASSTTAPNSTGVIIRAPLVATLTQQQAAGAPPVTNPGSLLDGGLNRSYGVINSAQGAPLFSASGGLGSSSVGASAYRWCLKSGSVPVNVNLTASSGSLVTSTCALTEAAVGSTVTLQSTAVGSTGTFNPVLQLDDGGNAAVPSSFTYDAASAPATSAPTNLLIHPAITTVTTNDSPGMDAAAGRSYGSNPAFPTLQDLTYTVPTVGGVSQGVGTLTLSPAGLPAGVACVEPSPLPNPAQPQINCNSGGKALSSTVAPAGSFQAYSIAVTVSDPGNFATPLASASTDSGLTKPDTLTVYGSLQASLSQATNPTPTTWFAGVGLRTYGIPAAAPTIGAPPTYAASGGLGGTGNSSYVWCLSPQSGPLPGGLGGVSSICGTTSMTKGNSIALTSGTGALTDVSAVTTYPSIKIQLDDSGDLAVPDSLSAGASAIGSPASITVNPHMAVIGPPAFVAGVVSRDYGVATDTCAGGLPCAPPVFQVSNGLGSYVFLPPSSAGFPAGFNCTTQVSGLSGTDTCSAAPVTGSAKTYSVQLTVSDPGNPAAPSQTLSYTSGSSLAINSILGGSQNPASLPVGVNGRNYGVSTDTCNGGKACAPITYTATGGLPAYIWPNPNTISGVSGFTCTPGGTGNSTDSCSALGLSAAQGGYNVSILVQDTANTAVPSNSFSFPSSALTVNASLGGTQNPSSLPVAVHARNFGVTTDICAGGAACAPLVYTATGGLPPGTTSTYVWPSQVSGVSGFSCTAGGTSDSTNTCSATKLSAAAGTYPSVTVTASDTANTSVPSGSFPFPNSSLTVNAALGGTSPAFPDGVNLRDYGVSGDTCASGKACAPIVYTVTGGLPNYMWPNPNTLSGVSGFTCTAGGTNNSTDSCSAANLAASKGSYNVTITTSDTADTSVPSGSFSFSASSLTVNAGLGGTQSPTTLPDGVTLRDYGVSSDTCASGKCAPIVYTATGGLPNYGWPSPNTVSGISGFTCAAGGTNNSTDSCSAANLSASQGSYSLTITATDTANAAVAGGSFAFPASALAVDGQLAMPAPTPFPIPDAVSGRTYGSGSACGGGCLALTYAPTGGLTPYSITGSGFPAPIACTQSGITLNCSSSSGVTGDSSAGSVSVTDTANASTPSGNAARSPSDTITVDPEIVIDNLFIENGTVGEPYSTIFSCIIPGSSPSACGGTGNPGNAAAVYTWCAGTIDSGGACTPSGGIPGVSMLSASTTPPLPPFPDDDIRLGYYQGVPSQASISSNPTFSGTFSVTDNGNPATPSCSAAGTCPTPLSTSSKVFPELGFVATYASGSTEEGDTLVEYNTGGAPFAQVGTPISLGSSASPGFPVMPRVTPDGQYAYVTLQGTNAAAAVDPVAGSVAATITVANTGTFNPTTVEVVPQIFNSSNPFVSYNAWLGDPTINNPNLASVEPVANAQSPTNKTLQSTNETVLPNTNVLASSVDGTRLFVTLSAAAAGGDTFEVLDITSIATGGVGQTVKKSLALGTSTNAVLTDPRANVAYVSTFDSSNNGYITVVSTDTSTDTYSIANTIPAPAANICSDNSIAGIAISPDARRLYAVCATDNNVHVFDVSGADPKAATFGAPVATIDLAPATPPGGYTNCSVAIDPKVNLSNTFLFVSCQNSDTISVVSTDTVNDVYTVTASISTDTSTGLTCGTGGSCPQVQDVMVNPALHITTGGDSLSDSSSPPTQLPSASVAAGAYATYIVAIGGTVSSTSTSATRAWAETTNPLLLGPGAIGACVGFNEITSAGEITGTPTTTGTCGPFTIRVTDASSPGQFVERNFEIGVGP